MRSEEKTQNKVKIVDNFIKEKQEVLITLFFIKKNRQTSFQQAKFKIQ